MLYFGFSSKQFLNGYPNYYRAVFEFLINPISSSFVNSLIKSAPERGRNIMCEHTLAILLLSLQLIFGVNWNTKNEKNVNCTILKAIEGKVDHMPFLI